jgi:hypothetical protein
MQRGLVLAFVLLMHAMPLRADLAADVAIPIAQIYEQKLLPIAPPSNSIITPTFKFFEGNKLVGLLAGAASNNRPLASAVRSLPSGFTNKALKDELIELSLKAPTDGRTVVVYLQNGRFCPPCDHILGDVKSRLPDVGWAKARVLVVEIVTN